ncbi:MAG: hypothetical protein RIS47_1321 [Bacteroidota bacterium]|jgi:hypothetical protein
MEENKIVRDQIFEIIKNQIKDNDPPETKLTYDRLMREGHSEFVTKQLIGQCVAVEMFGVMKFGEPFDMERFTANLLALPKSPLEDEG